MQMKRILAIVKLEMLRIIRQPVVSVFTMLLVPILILVFGFTLGNNYGWGPDYTIFEIMVPGFFAYAALLTINDVAISVAAEREFGLQKRINTTPLSSAEYIISQLIAYSIKPLIQFFLGLAMAYAAGYRPLNSVLGYLLIIVFLVILTFCSVGFGLITAHLTKSSSAAGGIAFAFIIPQQIFATFIPPEFMGAGSFKWIFPSYYATDSLGRIFAGVSLADKTIWMNFGILFAISVVIYIIGIFIYEKMKNK